MFMLIENVDNYQFVRGIFETELLANKAIEEIDSDSTFKGKFEIHEIELNKVVYIG